MIRLAACLGLALAAGCGGAEQGFNNDTTRSNEDAGDGVLEIDVETLIIDEVPWENGVSTSGSFTVTSAGDGVLTLYGVELADSGGGVLYMEPYDNTINLSPGTPREFIVVATLTENTRVMGAVRIQSNDGEQQLVELPVDVRPVGWEPPADTGGTDGTDGSGGTDGTDAADGSGGTDGTGG